MRFLSAVRVSDLLKRYGSTVALDMRGGSLEVGKGEIFVVIGPSGSGKTTFLRCIGGLEIPDQGDIVIGDLIVFSSTKKINLPPEKRGIGFVPQTWGLWPHMKVWDNIAFGLKIRKISSEEIRRRVKSVAESLKIDHLLDRYPWQLSGGQQQRVALARALVLEPSLLLLDEPISNLDAALRDEARLWLRTTIKNLKITSIYVTHDIREALTLGDRIALIADGRFRKIGTPHDIYRIVDDPVLASLLRYNMLRGKALTVAGDFVEIGVENTIIRCEKNTEIKEGSDVIVYLSPRDIVLDTGDLEIKILGTSYAGEFYELLAELNGQTLRIYSAKPYDAGVFKAKIERCLATPITS